MNVLRIAGLTAVLAVMGCGLAVAQSAAGQGTAAGPDAKMKTKSNIKNDRAGSTTAADKTKGDVKGSPTVAAAGVKSHSNTNNNRMAGTGASTPKTGMTPAPVNAGAKSHSNQSNNRMSGSSGSGTKPAPADAGKVKSHSNSTNN